MTFPRGPVATVDEWFAGARTGVCVLGAFLWGTDLPKEGVFYHFVSRVKEKGSVYTMSILKHLLAEVFDLTNIGHVVFWSDGGRHFRSNRSIATVGVRTMQALLEKSCLNDDDPPLPKSPLPKKTNHKMRKKTNFEVSVCFGVPKHFKMVCDTEFGILKQNCFRACKSLEVNEFDDAFKMWVTMDAEYRAANPNRKKLHFIDFVPEARQAVADWTIQFEACSYKEPIACCFSYNFRLNDTRRGNHNQI